ncbi:hypothetical protein FIU93_26160 [Labrenzia sp. THAF35]|uniref:hypothetical protein n=1 Tax=Stappiaceae TaxID=2821832 RepID=UPI0012690AE3|nr:hypothetical protein [Labrenzia sp. THAF35]QFT70300.1 hypothetical protein FIU93_26160 [Labrenzia sp. THAF35]
MSVPRSLFALPLALVAVSAVFSQVSAEETREQKRARRCAYYQEIVRVAFENVGRSQMRPGFVAEHDAFIEGGCFAANAVCPKTPAEFAFADILTMMTVSANMGSTFTPFRCPAGGAK